MLETGKVFHFGEEEHILEFKQKPIFCEEAAKYGNFEVLKYLHKNGYVLSQNVLDYSVFFGYLDCVKHLIEISCRYSKESCIRNAKENGHEHIVEYIESLPGVLLY